MPISTTTLKATPPAPAPEPKETPVTETEEQSVATEDAEAGEAEEKTRQSRAEKGLPAYPDVDADAFLDPVVIAVSQGKTSISLDWLASELKWPTDTAALSALRQRYNNYKNGSRGSEGIGPLMPELERQERGGSVKRIDVAAIRARFAAAKKDAPETAAE